MCSCPCSTKRIDNSNSRLVSQVDKETGESQILEVAEWPLHFLAPYRTIKE